MTEPNRASGGADVREWATITQEKALQKRLAEHLTREGVWFRREVWFRPMGSLSVLDTKSGARTGRLLHRCS